MKTKTIIAPSVLSADFANLQKDVEMLNQSQAEWIHIDIMDGVFVPNISFGLPVTAAIKKHATKFMDVHLMIVQPEKYFESFLEAGANMLTIHVEATNHLHRAIQHIKNLGMKAGVALNPHTNINQIEDVAGELDMVCLMSVNPGFGGQSFIPNTMAKLEKLNVLRAQTNSQFLIEIDGGVNAKNAPELVKRGADVLVAGSFVFNSPNPSETISQLLNVCE